MPAFVDSSSNNLETPDSREQRDNAEEPKIKGLARAEIIIKKSIRFHRLQVEIPGRGARGRGGILETGERLYFMGERYDNRSLPRLSLSHRFTRRTHCQDNPNRKSIASPGFEKTLSRHAQLS